MTQGWRRVDGDGLVDLEGMNSQRIPLVRYVAILLKLMIVFPIFISASNLKQFVAPQSVITDPTNFVSFHPECETCHTSAEPQKGSPLFVEGEDQSSNCLVCHDYRSNHHPVDFVPPEPYTFRVNESFPRFNGELKCLTCHEVHAGPGLSEVPKLLRGGPYSDTREVCFNCHYQEEDEAVNVHIMKDSSGDIREVNDEPVCLFCHTKMPDPEVDRTDDVTLKADVAFLCWRCHPPMPGEFFRQHFLVTPSKMVLETMQTTEKEKNVILPTVPRDRITCSTCHNPHQGGLLLHAPAQALAFSQSRLRLPKDSMCEACHYM